eukprot:m51a1_g545 hypothetical protein (257) ;mRNA; f:431583-434060
MAWALVALAAAAVLARVCAAQCEGEGWEVYDSAPYQSFGSLTLNANPRVCGDDLVYTSVGLAQVFTPSSVPWRFTRVCFLASVSDDSPQGELQLTGEIGTYEAVVDLANSKLAVGDRLSFAGFSAPAYKKNGTHAWVSVDLSERDVPLVAWSRAVFLGVHFWACGRVSMQVATAMVLPKGPRALSGIPSTWTCGDSRYNDGICDCGCGSPDPNCSNTASKDCPDGSVCDLSGNCVGKATASNFEFVEPAPHFPANQ